MSDYDLHYWPLPFRGQFVRAILAFAGKDWSEHGEEAIARAMEADAGDQPVPFMGPPMLIDRATGFSLSQMPAIAFYLGRSLKLLPRTVEAQAMTLKIVNDANDVIDEITLDGGREMWTAAKWREFVPRLKRWMSFWEAIGQEHGLTADKGFLLGTRKPGVADIVTATLWTTMGDRFPPIAAMLDDTAPRTAGLCRRVSALPALAALAARSRKLYGDAYCGGEIEASLRKVVGA
jgi:glutathione S-transferase